MIVKRSDLRSWISQRPWRAIYEYHMDVDGGDGITLDEAKLLAIPIDEEWVLLAWYLTEHEETEKAIAEKKVALIELIRPGAVVTGVSK